MKVTNSADVEYRGSRGTTAHCLEALAAVLQERRGVGSAVLVSGPADQYQCRSHMFILVPEIGPRVVVRDGFASGYRGEGPSGLTRALLLLADWRWDITEFRTNAQIFETIARAQMDEDLLTGILEARKDPISEVLFRYVTREALEQSETQNVWADLPITLPLPIVDMRIMDLARSFWDDPDSALHRGYRRLEDIVRERSGIGEYGARLFSRAFGVAESPLVWLLHGEQSTVFCQLFVGAFSGFRNTRAHREISGGNREVAIEFIQLNTLYVLESQLVRRPPVEPVEEAKPHVGHPRS